jgi:hypothetical protein
VGRLPLQARRHREGWPICVGRMLQWTTMIGGLRLGVTFKKD